MLYEVITIGNDDAAGGLFLGLDPANDHAVVERAEFHGFASSSSNATRCRVIGKTQAC